MPCQANTPRNANSDSGSQLWITSPTLPNLSHLPRGSSRPARHANLAQLFGLQLPLQPGQKRNAFQQVLQPSHTWRKWLRACCSSTRLSRKATSPCKRRTSVQAALWYGYSMPVRRSLLFLFIFAFLFLRRGSCFTRRVGQSRMK